MVSSSLKHQRGFGLVQVGIGIALFGMVSAYGIHMYAKSAKEGVIDDRAKLVGQRMADIDAAVKSYATQYFVQVQKGEPAQAVTGGYTVPASRVRQPTLQDLVQLGMLRSDAANSLTYNDQTISYAVDFSVDTTGCVIPACNIQAVIRTTAPITDTEGNVDVRRATIAANAASQNNAGVAIPAAAGGDPSKFVGTQGVVVAANPTGTAGLIGMRTAYDSKGFMEFDRRDGTLARTGVLRMQDDTGQRHDITGAGTVQAQSLKSTNIESSTVKSTGNVEVGGYLDLSSSPVVVKGADCPKNGIFARDNSGNLMSCHGGKWKSGSGGELPYDIFGTPTCNSSLDGQERLIINVVNGIGGNSCATYTTVMTNVVCKYAYGKTGRFGSGWRWAWETVSSKTIGSYNSGGDCGGGGL